MRLPRIRLWKLMLVVALLTPPLVNLCRSVRECADARQKRQDALLRAEYHAWKSPPDPRATSSLICHS